MLLFSTCLKIVSIHSRHTEKTVANCDLVMDNLAEFYLTAPAEELQLYNLVLLCGCVNRPELNERIRNACQRGSYTLQQMGNLPPLVIGRRRYARGGSVSHFKITRSVMTYLCLYLPYTHS